MKAYGKLILIVIALLCLVGCRTTMEINNITPTQTATILKDYAGIHGYTVTYQNDQTGSYRLSLGMVYFPSRSATVKTKQGTRQIPAMTQDQNQAQTLTSYEETTWESVSVPGHYAEATVMVRILQQGTGVQVILDSNDAVGSSLSDLLEYIKSLGYSAVQK